MPRPLAIRRHDEILRRLRAAGSASVSELAGALGVAPETIRRDLKLLAERGQLELVHGGAARRLGSESALAQRRSENAEGKAAIGRAAVGMVPEAGTVLLDSGTTVGAIALELAARRGLTICTNSLAHAALLCRLQGNRIYMLGGEIDAAEEAAIGVDVTAAVAKLRIDIAFVGVGGFAEDGGPTDYSRAAAEMRGQMIMSGRAYLVADHSKFARRTPFRIPGFARAMGVIVDRAPPAELMESWSQHGLAVSVAA